MQGEAITEPTPGAPAPQSLLRRAGGLAARLGVGLLFLGAAGGGVAALHLRADKSAEGTTRAPIPVATQIITLDRSFIVTDRFVGRLEPARETSPAFERAGLVTEMLVEEGDRVEQGQLLARLDTEPLEAQRLQLVAERGERVADLELAKLTAKRQERLHLEGHASGQRYDEARLAVDSLNAAIQRIDAAIRGIDIDLEKSLLRAAFPGRIAERFVDEGRVVSSGTPVLRLLESQRPQARIGLSPEIAAGLSVGDTVVLESNSWSREAWLLALRPDLVSGTRTVPALFALSEAEDLPFGEIVELAVTREVAAEGAWVPLAALSEGPKGLWQILTVVEDEAAGHRVGREAVDIRHVTGERAYVRGTLADGARIIVGGSNRVVPGEPVILAQE